MSTLMIITILMVSFYKEITSASINCESHKIPSQWTCKDLMYHLSAQHIEDTFYCVGYNRYEPVFKSIEFQREVIDLLEVNEQEHQITIYEKFTLFLNDSLLAQYLKIAKNISYWSPILMVCNSN